MSFLNPPRSPAHHAMTWVQVGCFATGWLTHNESLVRASCVLAIYDWAWDADNWIARRRARR